MRELIDEKPGLVIGLVTFMGALVGLVWGLS